MKTLSLTNEPNPQATSSNLDHTNHTKTAVFYSFGTFARSTLGFVVSSWLLYFYVPPNADPLIPVALYGVAMITGRAISAVLAPLIGYWSDNSQSRWGRRLPFMLIAGIPLALLFVLLWIPPVKNASVLNLVYLTTIFTLFRIALSTYQVPYDALLPEIASGDQHRVKISAWQSGFLLLGMVAGGVSGMMIDHLGYLPAILIFAGAGAIGFYLPFIVLREQKDRRIEASDRYNFRRSLSITLKNRNFLLFAAAWAISILTSSLVQSSAPFIVTEVCQLNKSDTIYFYLPGLIASLMCYPLITKLTKRWGKWKIYAGSFLAAAIVFPGTLLIGSWLPVSLKFQCVSWATLQAISVAGMLVLTAAFVAEITDLDHAATGQRREGIYYATMNMLEQIATGGAAILLPMLLLLGRSQLSPQGPLGVRLSGGVAGILMLFGFFIFLRYPRQET